jgi:hypothetical protein
MRSFRRLDKQLLSLGTDTRRTWHYQKTTLTGRTRTITHALLSVIQDLFAVDADLFLDEVCTWLTFEHNNTISLSTLSRTLEQAGLTRKILQKLAAERGDIRREEDAGSLLTNVSAEPMEDAFFQ